jgi:hypothetical protein
VTGYGIANRTGSGPGGLTPDRRTQLGGKYTPFANPFFDQAGTYTPTSMKELFAFCRHFFLTHGLINAIITKASEYPITDLIFEDSDQRMKSQYEDLFSDVLNYPTQQYAINIDLNCYGIAFVSVNMPFDKKIICSSCKQEHSAKKSRPYWRYTAGRFRLDCPKCGNSGFAESRDETVRNLREISIMRWNPERMNVIENEVTGRCDYILDLSPGFRNSIKMGRKDLVATTPDLFLEAVRLGRQVVMDPNRVFVMRRPGLSQTVGGWGVPAMMPVLKDAYQLQVAKRSNEAIMLQHLVPQVFIFPQPSTAGADPYITSNLADWSSTIRAELANQRRDPAYYGIVPFPLGHQVIGENGRSLLLLPEIQEMARQICVGMGYPPDLVFGTGNYSGNSVSMRMLENVMLTNVRAHKRLLRFVIREVSTFMGWPVIKGRFKPFRMADDLQRQAFFFSLNQAKKISDTTLLSMVDLSVDAESKLMKDEIGIRSAALREVNAVEADIAGDAQLVMAKSQAKAQEVLAESQARAMAPKPDPFLSSVSSLASSTAIDLNTDVAMRGLAEAVRAMPQDRKELFIAQLKDNSPDISALMQAQAMAQAGMAPGDPAAGGGDPMAAAGVDQRPLPEQRPPQRQSLVGGI